MDSRYHDTDRLPRWHVYLVLALMAASLVPIWITPRFPSQNGPWYLLIVQMASELGNPQWNYSDFYQVNWNPIPHSLHELLMLGLNTVLPLLTAEKVALSLYALAVPLSVFYFLGVVARHWKFLGYLSFLAIHTFTFYRGYQDFCLSIPLFFFGFAFWYRHRDDATVRHWIVLGLLSAATFFAHLLTFVMLAGTIGYFRLLETRTLRQALTSTIAATWIGWLLVVAYVLLVKARHESFRPEDTSFMPVHTALENVARNMFYTVSPATYVLAAAPWLWLAFIVGRRLWRSRAVTGSGLRQLVSDPIFIITTTLTLAYFAVPEKLAGWHEVNIRLIPFVLLMGLACAGPVALNGLTPRVRRAFVSSVAVAAFLVFGLLTREVVRMHADLEEYVSGIPHFTPNSRLLPIHVENDAFGQVRPVTRAHEYYHLARGGANGFSVARYAHLTLLWYQKPHLTVFPRFRAEAPEDSMRSISQTYEHVLLWGRDTEWPARLSAAGFRLVHQQGRLQLFRNEGSRLASSPHAEPAAASQPATAMSGAAPAGGRP